MSLARRNPQLTKELRPLVLPWAGTVVAGSLLALWPLADGVALESLLRGVVFYGFFGGLALVAAISFGEEFQERTLSLLLTQPLARARLWKFKLFLVAAAVLAALLVDGFVLTAVSAWYPGRQLWDFIEQNFSRDGAMLAGVFLVATVCSCGYWTLVARSLIGGLVFTVAGQFVAALAVALIYTRLSGRSEPFRDSATFTLLKVSGLVYSGVFLWLGRRKFLIYEVKQTQPGAESSAATGFPASLPVLLGLVSRPQDKLLNFVRKELRLLKPLAQLAVVFTFCWSAVSMLQWLGPKQQITYLFDVLVCLYTPITCLLAGCLSLGEEKALGLADSQLTLPFSPRAQYLLKLVVCAGSAALLSLVWPSFLFWITGRFLDLTQSGLMKPEDNGMLALACISGVAFILAFWSIAHVSNTVRAAIVSILGAIVVGVCFGFGVWWASKAGEWLTVPLLGVMCHFHLSPDALRASGLSAEPKLGLAMVAVIVLVMVHQGLRQFRRSERGMASLVVHSLILAALIVAAAFLSIDFASSLEGLPNSTPVAELRSALNGITSTGPDMSTEGVKTLLPEQLEGRVSSQTKLWLRGAEVSYQPLRSPNFRPGDTGYQASISFPNGGTFNFVGGFISNRIPGRMPVW